MLGVAGVDYEGPAPAWLRLRRCRIRTKNGAGLSLSHALPVHAWVCRHARGRAAARTCGAHVCVVAWARMRAAGLTPT